MAEKSFKKVEITRGPFDPGGQPETRVGQPLEFGFFAWNIKGGMSITKGVLDDPARYRDYYEWPIARQLIEQAELAGFDYQVPFGRWIGHGGATDFNGAALDFLATAAATAPITTRMGLFSTAHITYRFHPLHVAKFGATIDHISNGRWGLNIVSGYSAPELAAFGFKKPFTYEEAYARADEFCCLMKHLWHEDERFDFEGEYYQAYGAIVTPKPIRRPRPILMNAGQSDTGLDFGTRNMDWIFTIAADDSGFGNIVQKIHGLAAKHNRKVRVATMCWVLPEATDALAEARHARLRDEIDLEAALHMLGTMMPVKLMEDRVQGDPEGDPWGGLDPEFVKRFALGFTAPQLVGSYESVAEQMRDLHEQGLESLLLCFFDPQRGVHQMQDEIFPILKKMGLRN